MKKNVLLLCVLCTIGCTSKVEIKKHETACDVFKELKKVLVEVKDLNINSSDKHFWYEKLNENDKSKLQNLRETFSEIISLNKNEFVEVKRFYKGKYSSFELKELERQCDEYNEFKLIWDEVGNQIEKR
jgi:hypothetical protein